MRFYAEAISGYLHKGSGTNWADCLVQQPIPLVGEGLRVGKRYWETPRARNWRLWRSYLSFDTSGLATRTVRDAYLALQVKARGAQFAQGVRVYSQGTTPWGVLLEPGDWGKCNILEGTLASGSLVGDVRKLIAAASINKTGQTQFRLVVDEVIEPTADQYVVLCGADSDLWRPMLVVDTGNVYDDVCTNVAAVLDAHKSDLAVTVVHDNLPETAEPGHIYVGWAGGSDEDRQHIAVDVYWIGAKLGDATGATPSLDRAARQKADLLRRILRMDGNCNGYCTTLESCVAENASYPNVIAWTNDELLLGCHLAVTYLRELGPPGEVGRVT